MTSCAAHKTKPSQQHSPTHQAKFADAAKSAKENDETPFSAPVSAGREIIGGMPIPIGVPQAVKILLLRKERLTKECAEESHNAASFVPVVIRIFLTDHCWNLMCRAFGGALFGLCLDYMRQLKRAAWRQALNRHVGSGREHWRPPGLPRAKCRYCSDAPSGQPETLQ